MPDIMGQLVAQAVIVAALALYFLPSIVAWRRRSRHTVLVIIVNTFLGWTFVGWLVACALVRAP